MAPDRKETEKNGSMHSLPDSNKGTGIQKLFRRYAFYLGHKLNAQLQGNFWKVFLLTEWHFGHAISNKKIFLELVSSSFLAGVAHSRKPEFQETARRIFQFSAPACCAENGAAGAATFHKTIPQPLEIDWLELWGSFDAVILQLPT
eukprot:s422_g21.t1